MGYTNNMSLLLDKIERRIGTRPLNLPEELKKDKWASVIVQDTIPTFSRYYPAKVTVTLTDANRKGGSDYYLIDENLIPGDIKIIGVKDLSWGDPQNSLMGFSYGAGGYFGIEDYYNSNMWALEDIALAQMNADQASLFNNNIFVDFEPPNKVYLKNCFNVPVRFPMFKLEVFIYHSPALTTIEPTKMEIFEALAQCDVAGFLYQELKLFDNLETVFGNNELRLDDLQSMAQNRETIVEKLQDNYVSAGNTNQPLLYTI